MEENIFIFALPRYDEKMVGDVVATLHVGGLAAHGATVACRRRRGCPSGALTVHVRYAHVRYAAAFVQVICASRTSDAMPSLVRCSDGRGAGCSMF